IDQRDLRPAHGGTLRGSGRSMRRAYPPQGSRVKMRWPCAVTSVYSEVYTYDGLNQLTAFQRGVLNSAHTAVSGTVYRSQYWDIDAAGNFGGVTTDGTTVSRSHDAQNEVTAVGSTTYGSDANGN